MKKKNVILAAILLAGTASSALAAETVSSVFAAGNIYAVGSLGYTTSLDKVANAPSLAGLVGYQINSSWGVWGVEGGLVSLARNANTTGLAPTVVGQVKVIGLAVAGVYTHPINEHYSVLLRAGFSNLNSTETLVSSTSSSSTSNTSNGVLYGIAAQYKLNQQIAIRAGLDRYNYSLRNNAGILNNFNVSAVYKF